MAINGVIGVLPDGIYSSLYVDDLCAYILSTARISLIEQKQQLAINGLFRWAVMSGFRFYASKIVAMQFSRKNSVHPDSDLYLDNRQLSCVRKTS